MIAPTMTAINANATSIFLDITPSNESGHQILFYKGSKQPLTVTGNSIVSCTSVHLFCQLTRFVCADRGQVHLRGG